jgi:uncharacterized lipoprotein NlpE involved in copper resistance
MRNMALFTTLCFVMANAEEESCYDRGFSDTLVCSDCDKLHLVVKDNGVP